MVLKRPLYMQPAEGDPPIEYSALDWRSFLHGLIRTDGIMRPDTVAGGLKVSQRAAGANFSVDVAAGRCIIEGDSVADQGKYFCWSTDVENVVVPAPPASGDRLHWVVARLYDKLHDGGSTYEWTIELVEDTGSGASVPTSAIPLAQVAVSTGQASVTDTNIADQRSNAPLIGGMPPQAFSDSSRPPVPYTSELIWRTDRKDGEIYDGTDWRPLGVNPPTARLGRTATNQSIPNSTTTALAWNSESEDTHSGHDNDTNPSRYTAPIAGVYMVTVTVPWVQTSGGIREVNLRVDGTTTYAGARDLNDQNITFVQDATRLIRMNAGSYVEAVVQQSSGASLAIDRSFAGGPSMEICWMRP